MKVTIEESQSFITVKEMETGEFFIAADKDVYRTTNLYVDWGGNWLVIHGLTQYPQKRVCIDQADGSIMAVSMEHRFQRVEANELVVKRI